MLVVKEAQKPLNVISLGSKGVGVGIDVGLEIDGEPMGEAIGVLNGGRNPLGSFHECRPR